MPPELPVLPSHPLEYVPRAPVDGLSNAPPGPGFVSHVVVPGRRITQRVLLLGATGTEPAYLEAKAALDRIGVPYRSLIASTEALTAGLLGDNALNCAFSGVIVSTSGLGYSGPSGWQSALTTAQWQALDAFEAACGARELTWYGYPSSDYGLAAGPAFDSNSSVDGRLTSSGATFFKRVKSTALVPYRASYGYRATIADPATTVSLIEATDGGVLMATHTTADGREMLISTVDSSPYLTHALLLEYDMISWVNHGLFVGKKRAYIAPQIDDLFIADDLWVVGVGDLNTEELRITGADLTSLVAWQTARQASLPAGSIFKTALGFNGLGTSRSEYADATLLAATKAAGSKLSLVNHTYDHENMDVMTRASALWEVTRNNLIALVNGLTSAGINGTELITPDMSGLTNPNAVRGMLDAGVRYVVSDTSHTAALFPTNPGDNPSFNVGRKNSIDGRLYHIPRHPTSIYYDVNNPATETDEYNAIYRSYYGRDLAYSEVLDKDSAFGLFYLLQGDIDPLMFHQTNLAKFTTGGVAHTLYGDWIDAVFAKYLALTAAPVVTLREADLGFAMQARGALDSCGVAATKVVTATGANLELKTVGACTVPVTGLSSTSYGTVETYAGAPTTSVTMYANGTRTIPLPLQ